MAVRSIICWRVSLVRWEYTYLSLLLLGPLQSAVLLARLLQQRAQLCYPSLQLPALALVVGGGGCRVSVGGGSVRYHLEHTENRLILFYGSLKAVFSQFKVVTKTEIQETI